MTDGDIKYSIIDAVPDSELMGRLVACAAKVLDSASVAAWNEKLEDRAAVVIAYAESEGEIVGFKVGYELKPTLFYTWVGGVLPEFCSRGIATKMISDQLEFCKAKGFNMIKTISDNRNKEAMILNLRAGYDFCETKVDEEGILRVVMEKKL